MFAFVLFARYLSDWLITDLGHPDFVYTSAQAVTALALLALMPLAGVVADVLGRHKPLLVLFTVAACGSGALIGIVSPTGMLGIWPILALGVVAAGATALAFAQFDPLLATVAPRRDWGAVSGIAVAAGFVGIIIWLQLLAGPILGPDEDKQRAFGPASGLFLLLALPAFLLIRERSHRAGEPVPAERVVERGDRQLGWSLVGDAARQMRSSIGRLREHPGILRLLAGRFLYTDAVGTVNIYAVVYMSRLGGFDEADKNDAATLTVVFAGIGAVVAGLMVRRFGPRRALMSIMPVFCVGVALLALIGQGWTIWVLAPVIGVSLGTVYSVDRVFMLALTPVELRGELFGFFNLVGRVAQAAGPFVLWGGTIYLLHDLTGWMSDLDASRVALGLLAISAAIGLFVIRPLDDGSRPVERAASDPPAPARTG